RRQARSAAEPHATGTKRGDDSDREFIGRLAGGGSDQPRYGASLRRRSPALRRGAESRGRSERRRGREGTGREGRRAQRDPRPGGQSLSEEVLMAAIDVLFDRMLSTGASDLHVSVGYPPMLRLRGELVPQGSKPLEINQVDGLLDELLDARRLERFHREGDLDFAYAYGDRARFRANYFYKSSGPAAV